MPVRSSAARLEALAASVTAWEVVPRWVTLLEITSVPEAASETERLISAVVAVCSSTADAIVVWQSLISSMMVVIRPIASVVAPLWVRIEAMRLPMSSVARAVSWARSLTSPATTAKPLPASPARAASIVALRARRLVCAAMLLYPLCRHFAPATHLFGARGHC